jgi:hypothetical protein
MLKRVIARGSSLDGTVPESAPTFAQQVGGAVGHLVAVIHARGNRQHRAPRSHRWFCWRGIGVTERLPAVVCTTTMGVLNSTFTTTATPFVNRTYRLARAGDLRMTDWTS